MAIKDQTIIRNGVDVFALKQTIGAIQEQPELAKFKFRSTNKWVDGGINRSTIEGFYGTKQEHAHKKSFVFQADEPEVLLGKDKGANPVEYLLVALSACVTTGMVYHAAVRGIHIESLESSLEGDIDLRGFLGLSDEVPRGYQNIRITMKVKSNAPAKQLEELAEFSPVLGTVTKPVAVNLKVEKV
jgi:uncharacterized OsmC-like protein